MVKSKVSKTKKCPVCNKSAGAGTFVCAGCGYWIHPRCGDYKVKYLHDPNTDPSTLKCSNCKSRDFSSSSPSDNNPNPGYPNPGSATLEEDREVNSEKANPNNAPETLKF